MDVQIISLIMDDNEARFSPKKTTSRRNCCVPQCDSVNYRNPDLRFHMFPKEGEKVLITNRWNVREKCDRRKMWIRLLKIGKPVTKNMFVCSRHFVKSDYFLPYVAASHRFLKRTAVPSLNLPKTTVEAILLAERHINNRRRPRKENEIPELNLTTRNLSESINYSAGVKEEAEIDAEESNSRSSVKPSPLPSACSPLYFTPVPCTSPTLQCSYNINSSLPFPTPTSDPLCIPIEPTTPQTALEPANPINSRGRNSMKESNERGKEEDLLAALMRNQLKEMDECDLYCLSLAARLKKMPRQDMDAVRFEIDQILTEFAQKEK